MRGGSTDFYLNLDRWEDLSTIERQRGIWDARLESLAARLEPMRREATFQAGWTLFFPGKTPESKAKDRILGPTPPEAKTAAYLRAWRYCRAVQFVDGWHQRFAWNPSGVDQLLRLLTDPTETIDPELTASFLAIYNEAVEHARGIETVPILELAAYLGVHNTWKDVIDAHTQLYLIGLRILLLQKGYRQVLVSPIESHWLERKLELAARGTEVKSKSARLGPRPSEPGPRSSEPGRRPVAAGPRLTEVGPSPSEPGSKQSEAGPEALLGLWLDELTSLLLAVGKDAEESWSRAQSLAPRSGLQEAILTLALQHGRVSAGDIIRATSANRNTVKDNLARLVQEGVLKKQGQKRGTIYTPV
jgi:hypothetical protein